MGKGAKGTVLSLGRAGKIDKESTTMKKTVCNKKQKGHTYMFMFVTWSQRQAKNGKQRKRGEKQRERLEKREKGKASSLQSQKKKHQARNLTRV